MRASHGSRSSKDAARFGIKNAADEDIGKVALMLGILAHELPDAKLPRVKGEHEFADPVRADAKSGPHLPS